VLLAELSSLTDTRAIAGQASLIQNATQGLVVHIFLIPCMWAYLRIFLARSVAEDRTRTQNWRSLLQGAPLIRPPVEPPRAIQEREIIFECDAQGNPMRCHRDQCNGRWKPAR
jgi:hypothetical protein